MFKPLENTARDFADARAAYARAVADRAPEAVLNALHSALVAADAILTHLGLIDPYECGDCDNCRANAEARRAEMQAAVDADPAFAGPHLSEVEEAAARELLRGVFGDETQ